MWRPAEEQDVPTGWADHTEYYDQGGVVDEEGDESDGEAEEDGGGEREVAGDSSGVRAGKLPAGHSPFKHVEMHNRPEVHRYVTF
jgi:hypothetical protein